MHYPDPIELQETDSTNSYLSAQCDVHEMQNLSCVFSAFQRKGRGQRGNFWESEAGSNLLFSFVYYPTYLDARLQFVLSQATALSLYDVLSEYTEGISVKWPNDIYWNDKKICGTLIENDLTGIHISRSISGTGVNLNQEKFVSNAPNPVSLLQITGKRYDRYEILHQIMDRVSAYYGLIDKGDYDILARKYRKALYRRDGFFPYADANGTFRARIVGVEASGKLLLEDEDNCMREYMFKEVSFVI